MRYLLIALILTSCATFERSANRHLKLAERHIAKAKMKGAVIDETVTERVDTLDVGTGEWSIASEAIIDTVYIESKCDSLKSTNQETKEKAVRDIQEEVCPDVEEAITLSIPVTVNDSAYNILVNGHLLAHGGKLSIKLANDPLKIAYVTKTVTQELRPDKTKDWHKYALGALAGILLISAMFMINMTIKAVRS